MSIIKNILLLLSNLIFLFSCRKENINGLYAEINDTTREVKYYRVELEKCNILNFRRLNSKFNKSLYDYVPKYDTSFYYTLNGDSFKYYDIGRGGTPYGYPPNPVHYHFYHLGKIKLHKNKLVITGEKFTIVKYFIPYNYITYSDTTRYTKVYFKTKFLENYIKINK